MGLFHTMLHQRFASLWIGSSPPDTVGTLASTSTPSDIVCVRRSGRARGRAHQEDTAAASHRVNGRTQVA